MSGSGINENSTVAYNFGEDYLDGDTPTQFAHPFRDIVGADIAPEIPTRSTARSLGRNGTQASIMRQDIAINATSAGIPPTVDYQVTAQPPNPFFVRPGSGGPHQGRDSNPFMKYQTMMRMPNLVSKQSNVFVMRMTMGFFEVSAGNTANLGAEYNENIAQNKRHKMMYIIDRSKAVNFIPGQNTNVRDTVIYERRVE